MLSLSNLLHEVTEVIMDSQAKGTEEIDHDFKPSLRELQVAIDKAKK